MNKVAGGTGRKDSNVKITHHGTAHVKAVVVIAGIAAIGILAVSGFSPWQEKASAAADRDIVGVKYHLHDIGVAPDGSLELSDDADAKGSPVAFFEVGKPAVRFGSTAPGCSKTLAQGHLPIVLVRFDRDGVRYEETELGYSESLSPEAELWAYVALEAKADGPQGRSIDARFRVTPPIGANSEKSWEIKAAENRPAKIFLKVPFDLKNAAFQEIPEKEYAAAFVLDGRKVLPMEPETHMNRAPKRERFWPR
jgi:hypothetical protein